VIAERQEEIDGLLVAWREAPGSDPPILWVHGVPDSSEQWIPFLERAGGIAVDLPGFGRSAKPAAGPYSIDGYAAFLERFLDLLRLDRVRLVVHDWGSVALAFAMRAPGRIERLVAIDVVPFLPGYRWHRVARLWRTPVLGELAMGFTTKGLLRRGAGMPAEWAEAVMRHFDHGTQRAILKLWRASGPDVLERAGRDLGALDAPALVVWGERDQYLPTRFAAALAEALPQAEAWVVPDAGHWPWIDRPDVVERMLEFLERKTEQR